MYSHEFDKMMEGTDVEALKKELLRRGEVIDKLQDKLRDFEKNQIKVNGQGQLNFGCANGWTESPARDLIMESCKHTTKRTSSGNRGFCNTNTCTECSPAWTYWCDSSD